MANDNKVLVSDESFRTRLKDILDNIFPNRESAAVIAGKDKDMLGRYISGKSSPPFDTIAALTNYAEVSLEWLAYGRGNKYTKDICRVESDSLSIAVYNNLNASNFDFFTNDKNIHSKISISKEMLKTYNLSNECIGTIVCGDSMIPKLKNGDIAIIDCSITEFGDDNIYAFIYENHYYIKQLQKLGKEIGVKSLNQNYENWKIAQNETFKIIGQLKLSINRT